MRRFHLETWSSVESAMTFTCVNSFFWKPLWKRLPDFTHPTVSAQIYSRRILGGRTFVALSSGTNPQPLISPEPSAATPQEMYRTKSIATRLTEAEFAEVEGAATKTGKKISEWLREVVLGHVHAVSEEPTDPILLAEMMGMRSLMVNLFAKASEGPISSEDLRKMSLYADSIKEQKAREFLAQRRRQNGTK
jgi:hypothetical protein